MRADFAARAARRTGVTAPSVAQVFPGRKTGPESGPGTGPEAPGRTGHERPARWGLVLGGGGVLGAAWLIGALDALEQVRGLDARSADVIVGTSAGSIVGVLLAAGVPVAEQRDRQLADDAPRTGGRQTPPRPRLRPGSPRLVRTGNVPPLVRFSGLAPTGRARLDDVARLVRQVVPEGEWPEHRDFRAVALDYDTGRRVQLTAGDAAEAVRASCSIPGWFEPVGIDGHRYVDGGTWSITNADLLAGEGLDEVFVLAPMAATEYDSPTDRRARLERQIRIRNTRRSLDEARRLNAEGATVTLISPGPRELAPWGYNFMRPGRRKIILASATRSVAEALENRTVDLRDQAQTTRTGGTEPA